MGICDMSLEIPLLLNGPWKHCLILTYGVNVPFFENSLWREFGRNCHNQIIITKGNSYLKSTSLYAEKEQVRLLNQKYLVEGFFPSTFHPMAILLTNEEQGRLLVGSGNLSLQGYAISACLAATIGNRPKDETDKDWSGRH